MRIRQARDSFCDSVRAVVGSPFPYIYPHCPEIALAEKVMKRRFGDACLRSETQLTD